MQSVALIISPDVQTKRTRQQDTASVNQREELNDPSLGPTAPAGPSARFRFQHIPELDGFRGLAIAFVVVGRYWEFRGLGSDVRAFAQSLAHLGLLYSERNLTGSISFKRFYIRRALRLLPTLFLFLATVALLVRFGLVTDVPKIEFLECLLYLRNIFGHSISLGHIWSLSLEEQFYLIWPIS